MLRSLQDLEGYKVTASDGDIGVVQNFLLEDEHWMIRYLVARTDGFFDGRNVLISPVAFGQADWATRRLHVALTRDKVKQSPSVDTNLPVSRQQERDYYRHYGSPAYWGYGGLWGVGAFPASLAAQTLNEKAEAKRSDKTDDVHLRSVAEIRGYHIQGRDEAIGHLDDLIIDDETWQVRYLVIDTKNWWFGKKVLVAPHWASSVSWNERKIHVDMTRDAIKNSPEWTPDAAVNRAYETRLYDYYGRPVYWGDSEQPAPTHNAFR
jgi:hypothetical protein